MASSGLTTVTVWLWHGGRATVGEVVAAGRAHAARIAAEPRWEPEMFAPAAERARLRAELAEHLAELRRSGELRDTVAALLECGTRAVLAERGWDRAWPQVPTEARLPGRWPGSRDGGWPEKAVTRVDAALAARVRAACWWTSSQAIGELRRWRDAHPGPVVAQSALEDYERHAGEVTTTGDVWRAGVSRMLSKKPAG